MILVTTDGELSAVGGKTGAGLKHNYTLEYI